MHKSFFSAVRELYSLCDSERDAAKARTGGNLRGEHAILSPAIEREERSRARGLSRGPTVFQRTSAPALLRFFRFTAKGRRDAPKSPRERANTHRIHLCRSLALSRRRSARTLGRAARLIEGPTKPFAKTTLEKRKRSCERNENDYPERWITWLVGR